MPTLKESAVRRLKQLVTGLGARLPAGMVRDLSLVGNYLELGHWMRSHGFDVPRRLPDRTAVFDAIARLVADDEVLYLEFGVFRGASLRYWSRALHHPCSQLHGFDSFEGLPATFDPFTYPKGSLDVGGELPHIDDPRVTFHKGWFDETVPDFEPPAHQRLVVTLDADLYSSTILVLNHLRTHIRAGTVLYFDDMSRPAHEPAAFSDFLATSDLCFSVLAADRTLTRVAFLCVASQIG